MIASQMGKNKKGILNDSYCKNYFKSHGPVILLFSQQIQPETMWLKMFTIKMLCSFSPQDTEQFTKGGVVTTGSRHI